MVVISWFGGGMLTPSKGNEMYRFSRYRGPDRTYREEGGKLIRGVILQAVMRNMRHLTTGTPIFICVTDTVKVYEDSMVACWELTNLDGFRQKVHQGFVLTSLPDGAQVYLGDAGIHLTAMQVSATVVPDDYIVQVEDAVRALQGEATTDDLCGQAFAAYQRDPTDDVRARLRAAYEAVPQHLREFLTLPDGSEPNLDDTIRTILGLPVE
jgi:hypothetical protein